MLSGYLLDPASAGRPLCIGFSDPFATLSRPFRRRDAVCKQGPRLRTNHECATSTKHLVTSLLKLLKSLSGMAPVAMG